MLPPASLNYPSSTSVPSTLALVIYGLLRQLTMGSQDPKASPPSKNTVARTAPVATHALRYTLSQKEYETLYHYVLSRTPTAVKGKLPTPQHLKGIKKGADEYNVAAIRASLRLFLATQTGLKLWDWISAQISRRRGKALK